MTYHFVSAFAPFPKYSLYYNFPRICYIRTYDNERNCHLHTQHLKIFFKLLNPLETIKLTSSVPYPLWWSQRYSMARIVATNIHSFSTSTKQSFQTNRHYDSWSLRFIRFAFTFSNAKRYVYKKVAPACSRQSFGGMLYKKNLFRSL